MPSADRARKRPSTRGSPSPKTHPAAGGTPDLPALQGRLLDWFDEHGRAFPWRETRDPYHTLVAEVMLQQTQTGRVAPAYEAFLDHFPTLQRLAHAPAMDVIRAWKGLGYNRRAVELHQAAQAIEHDHGGVFPEDARELRRLPGLGEYSANAVACFAFDAQVPVVDTNVRRVLARAAFGKEAQDVPVAGVADTAVRWLPRSEAYRWNQALMDVGAMVCRPVSPLCPQCPLARACLYRAQGLDRRPRAPTATKKEAFEGSRRQLRGGIVDQLRKAARKGISLATLAERMHPNGHDRDLSWLVEILERLEEEGLAELTPGARRGSPRGLVRLPR